MANLQGHLQNELTTLAEEIDAAGPEAEASLGPEVAEKLESVCTTLSEASEALQTVREARSKLQGFKRPAQGQKGRGASRGAAGRKPKGRGLSILRQMLCLQGGAFHF